MYATAIGNPANLFSKSGISVVQSLTLTALLIFSVILPVAFSSL
jgi:hypothetical protein